MWCCDVRSNPDPVRLHITLPPLPLKTHLRCGRVLRLHNQFQVCHLRRLYRCLLQAWIQGVGRSLFARIQQKLLHHDPRRCRLCTHHQHSPAAALLCRHCSKSSDRCCQCCSNRCLTNRKLSYVTIELRTCAGMTDSMC